MKGPGFKAISIEAKPGGLRQSGISAVGDMPWGTHFCHFYETKNDLLDILIPYFKTGLEQNEFCLWVLCDPLDEAGAKAALRRAAPRLDQHLVLLCEVFSCLFRPIPRSWRGMAWNQTQWEQSAKRLPQFLSPLVQDLGRSERRVGATLYVEGLLLPGQRKSIGPMAERLGVDSQKLQQFITDSPWDESAIGKAIRPVAVDCLEPLEAWHICTVNPRSPAACDSAGRAGISSSIFSARKTTWGWITLRGAVGRDSITIWSWRCSPICSW